MDISASGMRVRCDTRPTFGVGARMAFLIFLEDKRVTVPGRVAWLRRFGWVAHHWQFGVRFTDSNPSVRTALQYLAEHGNLDAPNVVRQHHNFVMVEPANDGEDLYVMLGVSPTASHAEIRTAYLSLVRSVHPDWNAGPDALELFGRYNQAYAILRHASTRYRYDQHQAGTRETRKSEMTSSGL